jgi:hypothetical protein
VRRRAAYSEHINARAAAVRAEGQTRTARNSCYLSPLMALLVNSMLNFALYRFPLNCLIHCMGSPLHSRIRLSRDRIGTPDFVKLACAGESIVRAARGDTLRKNLVSRNLQGIARKFAEVHILPRFRIFLVVACRPPAIRIWRLVVHRLVCTFAPTR